jgi:uncharacterized membrane protein
MLPIYVIHILAGSLGLLSGYIALFSAKGAVLHRRSGMVFVYAMLTMCVAGTSIAAIRNVAPTLNIPAALLTSYFVITSLTTVRPVERGARALAIALMILGLGVGLTDLTLGVQSFQKPGPETFGFMLFGMFGTLGAAGDFRVIRSGALKGASRIARHLWRMTFALFIAAMSFFIGQAKVIPKAIRIPPLLALPVLVVLVSLLYWMWRVRFKRSLRGVMIRVRGAEVMGT